MNYGCIAERLSHSFSKEIHAKLFDYNYELVEIPRPEFASFMKKRDFKGINVTIPYKEAVIPFLDEIDDAAAGIGAVNTVVNRNGRLYGYNTDIYGMCMMLRRNRMELTGKKVLILGSGGTSKTAFAAAAKLGAREILRVSRGSRENCVSYEEAAEKHNDAEVIINTTPCGMYPNIGQSMIDLDRFPRLSCVVDAVYNPLRSKLVCDARSLKINACGGLFMLVAQAALAAEKFTGMSVPESKIEEIFRQMTQSKENIVLIGMPGSGKTTVGRILSQKLGMAFTDTDEEIKKNAGCEIPEIFKRIGEDGFRELESEAVRTAALEQHTVIATGGGVVKRRINTDLLRENGRLFFIDRPLSDLPVTDDRPLSASRAAVEHLYDDRYELYRSACDVHITDARDAIETAERIKEGFLNEIACY